MQGDIIPTSTGGRQVVFDDVEVLQQVSPTKENRRTERASPDSKTKRRSKRSYEDIGRGEETGMGGVGR